MHCVGTRHVKSKCSGNNRYLCVGNFTKHVTALCEESVQSSDVEGNGTVRTVTSVMEDFKCWMEEITQPSAVCV